MPEHWYDTVTEKCAIRKFRSVKCRLSEEACYSSFSQKYVIDKIKEGDGEFYYAYDMPIGFTDPLLERFNATFSHIKVRVVDRRPLYRLKNAYGYSGYGTPGENAVEGKDYVITEDSAEYILFVIEYDPDYSDNAKYFLTLWLAQFLRNYCPQYGFWKNGNKLPEDPLWEIIDIHNNHAIGRYGALCNVKITKELILAMDDVELMNDFCEGGLCKFSRYNGGMPYASEFFKMLQPKISVVKSPRKAE